MIALVVAAWTAWGGDFNCEKLSEKWIACARTLQKPAAPQENDWVEYYRHPRCPMLMQWCVPSIYLNGPACCTAWSGDFTWEKLIVCCRTFYKPATPEEKFWADEYKKLAEYYAEWDKICPVNNGVYPSGRISYAPAWVSPCWNTCSGTMSGPPYPAIHPYGQ
jgi:hypothetical protein